MARIAVMGTVHGEPVVASVVPMFGAWMVQCSGDRLDQCPEDVEPGDSWELLENAVLAAVEHVKRHERRN